MNYYVNSVAFNRVEPFPIDCTDFSDYPACFSIIERLLHVRPRSYIAVSIVLEEEGVEDRTLIVQYRYSGTPGKLAVTLIDPDEGLINEDLPLFLNQAGKVVSGPELEDETVEEIVKIILDYGEYFVLGVQWAAFLTLEQLAGTLEEYFDDLTQEIH